MRRLNICCSIILILKLTTLQAQPYVHAGFVQPPPTVSDSLSQTDWHHFEQFANSLQYDSAYHLISKKLTLGKHYLTPPELIQQLPHICASFIYTNHAYQLLPILNSVKAFVDSQSNAQTKAIVYGELTGLYVSLNDWKKAFQSSRIADSLNRINKEIFWDSLFNVANNKINISNIEIDKLAGEYEELKLESQKNVLNFDILLGISVLLFLLVLIILIRRRKNRMPLQANTQDLTHQWNTNTIAQTIQVSKWISALMLQKGRAGDDLNYLKTLEQYVLQAQKEYFSLHEVDALNEDYIIQRLKYIHIQIIGNTAIENSLLKDIIKRVIRLADIQTSEHLNAATLSKEADAYIIINPHPSLIDRHQLPEQVKSKLITIGFTKEDTLVKPFELPDLFHALMRVYAYKEDEQESPFFIHSKSQIEFNPLKQVLLELNNARMENNRIKLMQSLHRLRELTSDNDALHNWIDKLTNHYDEMNALQIDLALRNIVSYLSKK